MLPKEVLKTEANPIDTPDSTVRPPVETVLPQPQDRANSGGQQSVHSVQSAANTGGVNGHAAGHGRADVSSFLSEQVGPILGRLPWLKPSLYTE